MRGLDRQSLDPRDERFLTGRKLRYAEEMNLQSMCLIGCASWLASACGLLGGKGFPCTTTSDCSGDNVCVAGQCGAAHTKETGDVCTASRDCVEGLYCTALLKCDSAGTGEVGAPCQSDGACLPGLRCDFEGFGGECRMEGTKDLGESCTEHGDCIGGLYCHTRDRDCQPAVFAFPQFAGVECTDEGAFRSYFEVPRPGTPPADFYRLPFPSDIRVGKDGRLDMSDFPDPGPTPLGPNLVKDYVTALVDSFDGFSTTASVMFRFSENIDFASTETENRVRYLDLTSGGQGIGFGWGFDSGKNKFACPNQLTARNELASPLLPNHTYAVLLMAGIKSKNGLDAAQDADLAAVLLDTRPTGDEALGHAWDQMKPLRDYLGQGGIAASSVIGAAVFTTADPTVHMDRLAKNLLLQPGPQLKDMTLCDTAVTSPCDDGSSARACQVANSSFHEIHGRFTVPIYQQGIAPYENADMGGDIPEVSGIPQVQRTEDVCFALTIPKAVSMPSSGWPLMVYHHGTGGGMRSFVSDRIAGFMAVGATPSAVLSFDAIEHGARRGASEQKPDNLVFNPLNPKSARDNLLQGAVDILQAFRVADVAVASSASPTGSELRFDKSKVTYFGHSQGGTSGELALPFTDAAPAVILSGAGSFLTASLLDKSKPVDIGEGMKFLIGEELDRNHPVMVIFQTYFDRSDPLNYNPLLLRRPPAGLASKHIFMTYGPGDSFSPPSTLDANARSLGVPQVAPTIDTLGVATTQRPVSLNVTGGDGQQRSAAVFQYATDGYDGHFVSVKNDAAIADWLAFLQSWLASGTPTVP